MGSGVLKRIKLLLRIKVMKNILLQLTLSLLLFSAAVLLFADEAGKTAVSDVSSGTYSSNLTGFEVGGLLGVPSGFTMRYWFSDRYGLEAITGFSLDTEPLIGVDFIYKPFGMFHAATWNLYFTVGAGFMASYVGGESAYIARFPLGLTMPLDNYPVQFTLYGAPAVQINQFDNKEIQWGVAVTYSFSRGEYLFEKRQQSLYKNWKLESEVEGLKSGLDETKGQLSKTEGDLEKTRGKLSDTESELNSIRGELGTTKKEMSKLQDSLSSAKGELETAKTTLGDFKIRLDGAKEELNRTRQKLDEKDRELKQNQADLDKAKEIMNSALDGTELEEEKERIAQKQRQLDRELKRLAEEKISLKKGNEQESEVRSLWAEKCTVRRGVLNSDGECVCRVGETWNSDKSACVCIAGYSFNKRTERCEPCAIIDYNGACVSKCDDDENQVSMKKGPHKYVCVKKCRGKNEVWIRGSNRCGCIDGYNYDNSGKCVPRR
jgi:predicted  nucleic acid-binding Zn-ribbon protein